MLLQKHWLYIEKMATKMRNNSYWNWCNIEKIREIHLFFYLKINQFHSKIPQNIIKIVYFHKSKFKYFYLHERSSSKTIFTSIDFKMAVIDHMLVNVGRKNCPNMGVFRFWKYCTNIIEENFAFLFSIFLLESQNSVIVVFRFKCVNVKRIFSQ